MINFQHLLIEGFGSISKPLTFDLNTKGVFLVKGKNGSGKTSIFNALCWALYGVNLKGVNVGKLVTKLDRRHDEFQGTRVIIMFEKDGDSYVVARHLNFKGNTLGLNGGSTLLVWKNEILVNLQHKDDYQKYIQNILNVSSNIFLNSVLFGQRMKRFIDAKPSEKRQIFEEIFDLSFVDILKEKAVKSFSQVQEDINKLTTENIINKNTIQSKKQIIDQHEKYLENYEFDRRKEIDRWNKVVDNLDKEFELLTLEPVLEKHIIDDTILVKISNLKNKIHKLNNDKAYIFDPEPLIENCITCGAPLNPSKLEQLKAENQAKIISNASKRSKIDSEIELLQKELNSLEDSKKSQKELIRYNQEIDNAVRRNDNVLSKKTHNREMKSQAIEAIKAATEKQMDTSINISEIKTEILNCEFIIEENLIEIDVFNETLEAYKWWKDVGLTSKGIKSFILNSALIQLNHSVHKYASRSGLHLKFSIDTSKASKPFVTECYLGDMKLDYDEFSGGEKARIEIATAFAIHDLVSSTQKFNILIMDEIFEGLDEEGKEEAFDLIRMKSEGLSLFVITHSQLLDSLNTQSIYVTKTDSTYVE